jgi:hypothetical protein
LDGIATRLLPHWQHSEKQLRAAVKAGGGRWIGLWNVQRICICCEPMVIFETQHTHTILAVPVRCCTASVVAKQIEYFNVVVGIQKTQNWPSE